MSDQICQLWQDLKKHLAFWGPFPCINEGKIITNSKTIAEYSNKFFTKIGTNIQNKVSHTIKFYADYLLNPKKSIFHHTHY